MLEGVFSDVFMGTVLDAFVCDIVFPGTNSHCSNIIVEDEFKKDLCGLFPIVNDLFIDGVSNFKFLISHVERSICEADGTYKS